MKKSFSDLPIDKTIEEFDVVDDNREITGTFVYGHHAIKEEACNIANKLASERAIKKGTCFKAAKPEDCTSETEGIWTARVAVANHKGSCGGREWHIGAEYPIYRW